MLGRQAGSAARFVLVAMLAISWGCASGGQVRRSSNDAGFLADITYPYFLWTDAWHTDPGDKRYFDIAQVMDGYDLSRFRTAELQNQYRDAMFELCQERDCKNRVDDPRWATIEDFSCLDREDREKAFGEALDNVRKGRFESGWSDEESAAAAFIVVFDVDLTLLWHDPDTHDYILAPGVEEAIMRVKALGGSVVLFTAKVDFMADPLFDRWTIESDGEEVLVRDFVDGLFTNNHLVLQPRGKGQPRALTATKDLRIIEEALTKTVIIDDNPARIMQFDNLRYLPKWYPVEQGRGGPGVPENIYAAPRPDRLLNCIDEIEESLQYAEAHNVTLAEAFLPYSYSGRHITSELAQRSFEGRFFSGDGRDAVTFVREHPELVTPHK